MSEGRVSTKDVLKILAVGGGVVSTLVFPNLPMALGLAYKQWKKFNRRDLGMVIKRLQKQEMIKIKENNGKLEMSISEKGKQRLLEYDFENIALKSKKRDGKWRLVIFDIPESRKSARDVFRRKLLQLGFVRVQDSVFASAFPCKNEIDFLCNFLEISNFVTLVSLNKFERGEELIFKQFPDFE